MPSIGSCLDYSSLDDYSSKWEKDQLEKYKEKLEKEKDKKKQTNQQVEKPFKTIEVAQNCNEYNNAFQNQIAQNQFQLPANPLNTNQNYGLGGSVGPNIQQTTMQPYYQNQLSFQPLYNQSMYNVQNLPMYYQSPVQGPGQMMMTPGPMMTQQPGQMMMTPGPMSIPTPQNIQQLYQVPTYTGQPMQYQNQYNAPYVNQYPGQYPFQNQYQYQNEFLNAFRSQDEYFSNDVLKQILPFNKVDELLHIILFVLIFLFCIQLIELILNLILM